MARRNFGLSPSKEGIRPKAIPKVTKFNIEEIFEHFSEALKAIWAQLDIADELCKQDKATEAEYIWRSQVVFLASALDFYMHELTKLGLCEIYETNWDKPDQYNKIKIRLSIKSLETALKEKGDVDRFRECINDSFKTETMISNDRIADQLSLLRIDYQKVAYEVFPQKDSEEALKRRLDGLWYRRNEIAHQTDRTHFNARLQRISKGDVRKFVEDVEKLVTAINDEAKEKDKNN